MKKYIIVCFAFFGFIHHTSAQPDTDLEGDKVDVIKTFEAQLEETSKVDLVPQLPALDTTTQQQVINIPARNFDVEYPAPRIRPLAIKRERLTDPFNTYLKAGVGLPRTFYGEGSFHKFVDNLYEIGGRLRHHSANFSGGDIENQKFRETGVGIDGTYYFPQGFAVRGGLGFDSDRVHYYGYNYDPSVSDTMDVDGDDVKQVFNTFSGNVHFFNSVRLAGDLNYDAGIEFYSLNDNFSAGENGFRFNVNAAKWIEEDHSLELGLISDLTKYTDTLDQTLNNFYIQPKLNLHFNKFYASVGLNAVTHDRDFSFFPDAEVGINVIGSEVTAFLGAKGDLQKNTFQSLTDYNPFVVSRFPGMQIRNTDYLKFYGGIKGNIKIVEYRAEISYQQTDNLALFLSNHLEAANSLLRRFNVVYDDGNIFSISGTVKAAPIKNLEVLGTVGYNVFDLENQSHAWHLPSLEINGSVFYTLLDDDLTLKGSIFLENGVPIPSSVPGEEKVNLNSLYDLSVGGEYRLTDRFSLFLDVNNIFNNERERWEFYPTYGINALMGVTAKF